MEHYYALCSTLLQDIINNMHFALVKIFMFIQSKMQSKVHWNEYGRIVVIRIST